MTKDFRTPDYCVKTIQNTRQFREVFSAIIANLYNQINFQKEVNVGQNYLTTQIAKKLVIDSGGFKSNSADPWAYPAIGTATLSAINVGALQRIYELMRRMVDVMPFAFANGMPMYAAVMSPELISRLYMDDPSIRADIRAVTGDYAKGLVEKYNFTESIRNMFLPVPYLWPRRFRWDAANTRWIRVLPFIKGIPGVVGTFAGTNPLYEDPSYATHEEILLHGKDPFTVFYQPTVQSIGEGTDFGGNGAPESGFWDIFKWINPQTRDDPERREGYFFTSATIGLSADNSEGVYGILVPRPPVGTMIAFYPASPCPPDASACTNEIPETGCPVSVIQSFTAHPITAGTYFVTFEAPVDAVALDVIQLGHSNGGYVNATVVSVSADGKTFEVTIPGTLPECDRWISVYTGDSLGCSATILGYSVDLADNTRLDLVLDRPIKADTAADAVTLVYGNGSTQSGTVVSFNMLTNVWKIDIGGTAFANNVGGLVEICVPTATDASCPACGSSYTTETQCEEV